MRAYIHQIMAGHFFNRLEMQALSSALLVAPVEQQAAVLALLTARGETVDEILGARDVLVQKSRLIPGLEQVVDIVGTGGDGANVFNVSTAASLLLASCGVAVAKHGGRGATSPVGSADVAEAFGLTRPKTVKQVHQAIARHHYAYLWAPLFNPELKTFGRLRRNLGVPGLLNLLGPLLNPTQPKKMVVGVFRKPLVSVVAETLKALQVQHAWVVFGEDGVDKLSLSGATRVAELKNGHINTFTIEPEDVGLKRATHVDLVGTTAAENARCIQGMLSGEVTGAKLDMVLLNTAAGLIVAGEVDNLKTGIAYAKEAIQSGKTKLFLTRLTS